MTTEDPTTAALHVLGVAGIEGGMQPGSFVTKLIEAILAADPINRAKLGRAFDVYVSAVELYEAKGPDWVLRWANWDREVTADG